MSSLDALGEATAPPIIENNSKNKLSRKFIDGINNFLKDGVSKVTNVIEEKIKGQTNLKVEQENEGTKKISTRKNFTTRSIALTISATSIIKHKLNEVSTFTVNKLNAKGREYKASLILSDYRNSISGKLDQAQKNIGRTVNKAKNKIFDNNKKIESSEDFEIFEIEKADIEKTKAISNEKKVDLRPIPKLCEEVSAQHSSNLKAQSSLHIIYYIQRILDDPKKNDTQKYEVIQNIIDKEKTPTLKSEILELEHLDKNFFSKLNVLFTQLDIKEENFPEDVKAFMHSMNVVSSPNNKSEELIFDNIDKIKNFIRDLPNLESSIGMEDGVALLKEKTQVLAKSFQSKLMEGATHKDWEGCRKEMLGNFFTAFEDISEIKLTEERFNQITTGTAINANLESDLKRIETSKSAFTEFNSSNSSKFVSKQLFEKLKSFRLYIDTEATNLGPEQKKKCLEALDQLEAIALIDELEIQADNNYKFERDGDILQLSDFSASSFEIRILEAITTKLRTLQYKI